LRERLQAVASQILEAVASDIEIGDGRAFVRGTDLGVEVRQVARAAYHQSRGFPRIKHTTRTIERNHAIKAEVTFCVRGVISPLRGDFSCRGPSHQRGRPSARYVPVRD
jgi:hypothetical protein